MRTCLSVVVFLVAACVHTPPASETSMASGSQGEGSGTAGAAGGGAAGGAVGGEPGGGPAGAGEGAVAVTGGVTGGAAGPSLLPPPANLVGTDARALVNAWRVQHNAGIALLGKGDAAGALAAGRDSLALAPAEQRADALVLVAAAAAQAGDVPIELEALTQLSGVAGVPWGLFYNGSVDAASVGRVDLASRFALEAFARTDAPAVVGPMAIRAAVAAGDLDGALRVAEELGAGADASALATLARALSAKGRCVEARKLDPGSCG